MRNGKGEWLHATDPHPNSAGARRLGLQVVDGEGLSRFLYGGAGLTLILDPTAHPFLASPEALQLLRVGTTVVWARREHPAAHAAAWLLPTPSLAGNEGTFTSSAGAVQRFAQAFTAPGAVRRTATGAMSPSCPTIASPWGPPGEARPLWRTLAALARELGVATLDLVSPADVFALLVRSDKAFAGLAWEKLGGARPHESFRERQHVG
jgi:NADH dehydrogenase/NADH:ubiquinone oxidoreductase subunit G